MDIPSNFSKSGGQFMGLASPKSTSTGQCKGYCNFSSYFKPYSTQVAYRNIRIRRIGEDEILVYSEFTDWIISMVDIKDKVIIRDENLHRLLK